jgi:hypothetical protein
MLRDVLLSVLLFMLSMYALTILYGVVFAIVYATKKMYRHVANTIAYVILLGLTTAMCALPFLKMHGNYSDMERVFILLFCILNIFLMILFAVSRYIVFKRATIQTSQAAAVSNASSKD